MSCFIVYCGTRPSFFFNKLCIEEKETGTAYFSPESLCYIDFSAYLNSFYFVLSIVQTIIPLQGFLQWNRKITCPKILENVNLVWIRTQMSWKNYLCESEKIKHFYKLHVSSLLTKDQVRQKERRDTRTLT